MRKVFLLGLDCAAPELIFDKWRQELPNLRGLIEKGIYGKLESTIPPITCPAWMSMATGKNPGRLGFYGFRNRKDYSYDQMFIANSVVVKEPCIWDVLSGAGKRVILLGVPQTYPPKPVNGIMVTSFLTPSTKSQYTYPAELKEEIGEIVGDYKIDVENFRTNEKDRLVDEIYEMTKKRFQLARHFVEHKLWDFFFMVEMGPDRIHHGFWKYFDKEHRKYQPGSKYENVILEYYKYLDQAIGQLLGLLGKDTVVMAVSDHGAQRMDGGICLNEWLIKEGYLVLKEKPGTVGRLENVDWSKTKAWGSGGYYGRVFLNVKGREPEGVINLADYEKIRDELVQKLEALGDEKGNDIGTKVYKPEDVYPEVRNIAPDLIVYFGNLAWRAVGSIGLNTVHTFENDTGPDDANHSQHGIFILKDPRSKARGKREDLNIKDVTPTILNLMGIKVPDDMEGKSIYSYPSK
jgi:predicted AlkP superfamily phosphohydrolase/phosphomutase